MMLTTHVNEALVNNFDLIASGFMDSFLLRFDPQNVLIFGHKKMFRFSFQVCFFGNEMFGLCFVKNVCVVEEASQAFPYQSRFHPDRFEYRDQ